MGLFCDSRRIVPWATASVRQVTCVRDEFLEGVPESAAQAEAGPLSRTPSSYVPTSLDRNPWSLLLTPAAWHPPPARLEAA